MSAVLQNRDSGGVQMEAALVVVPDEDRPHAVVEGRWPAEAARWRSRADGVRWVREQEVEAQRAAGWYNRTDGISVEPVAVRALDLLAEYVRVEDDGNAGSEVRQQALLQQMWEVLKGGGGIAGGDDEVGVSGGGVKGTRGQKRSLSVRGDEDSGGDGAATASSDVIARRRRVKAKAIPAAGSGDILYLGGCENNSGGAVSGTEGVISRGRVATAKKQPTQETKEEID
jgi:hypothetical protein